MKMIDQNVAKPMTSSEQRERRKIRERLYPMIFKMEKQNLATKEYTDAQMVEKIRKLIEENAK